GMVSMVQLLYKIAFQDLDAQKVVGKGWTEKQASAITGSTMELGNRSGFLCPFEKSVDKPHNSISMGFGVGENGEIVQYNNKDTDPMPIKTINMSGLQKWEETEDYIIYLDKDAVIVEGVPTEYEACFRVDKKTGEISTDISTDIPQVVTRGLIEHFDFADGKGTEATLKSRVSDNVLTLSGFNFDENSGWTGKGLKFDGVNDFATSPNAGNAEYMEIVVTPLKIVGNSWNRIVEFGDFRNVLAKVGGDLNDASLYLDNSFKKIITCQMNKANVVSTPFSVGGSNLCFCKHSHFGTDFSNAIIHSIKIYNVALTPEEIAQNYEYEQSIDRTSTQMLPDNSSELSYGIGLSNQLSDEQKASFRLSVDGTKFVAGMRYCEELEVVGFTYADIQIEMKKEEWTSIEEEEVE
ncbi:MAG: hypothetical protein ACRC0G_11550, partial [Fusobacteriaceae bacterium]